MLKSIYNQKVTILNKLRRTDNDNKVDAWYKATINDVAWYTKSARSAGGSSVYIGTYVTVLIPFHEEYVKYLEWKDLDDKENYYTVSNGDYIILGEIEETDITADNIIAITQKYGENVCQVKHHNESYDRFGAKIQLKVEGV